MVDYNPKTWWKLIFMFHRSDTFRMLLPAMLGVAVYTAIVAYLENDVFHVQFKSTTVVHSLVGFILSMLLVFRTNTAYDRWWEGRRLWGNFTNNSRNFALKINALIQSPADKKEFRVYVTNYVWAVKEHLRGYVATEKLDVEHYNTEALRQAKHVPNYIMGLIYGKVHELCEKKVLLPEHLIYLNNELQSFTDNVGACERIKNTPIPYSYSLFLKKIIFLYIFTMPIGFVLDFKYWAVVIVALVFYAFASIELLAEEIENPFGTDSNDLPLDKITRTIKDNLVEILG